MYIPVFEIKDSYIVKHRLNYNTSYNLGEYVDDNFVSYKQRMIFTDYDLARKSQSLNAENFKSVEIINDLNDVTLFSMYYLDEVYKITMDGILEYENQWIKDVNVFNYFKPLKSQEFKLNDFYDNIYINEIVTVEIYQKVVETGTVSWEYTSVYDGEKWYLTGITPSGKQWILEQENSVVGYETGTSTWIVESIEPLLKYDSKVLSRSVDSVFLENKIESYLFNNFSNMNNVYYKVISNNHCEKSYSDILNKLRYFKYYDYFDYTLKNNYLRITPKKNTENIYFYYDKLYIRLGTDDTLFMYPDYVTSDYVHEYLLNEDNVENGYVISGYVSPNYVYNYMYYEYRFETDNIYNKYTLDLLLSQFITDTSTYNIYVPSGDLSVINDEYTDYSDSEFIKLHISDTSNLKEFTFVKCTTIIPPTSEIFSIYNLLIYSISDGVVTVYKPHDFNQLEKIISISNITTIKDISGLLERTFENINIFEYRKYTIDIQRKIYNSYAEILNKLEINQPIRVETTGILYQNEKNIMILKIFDPTDFKDKRLLYEPTELVRIGKDRKTSIPIIIKEFTLGISADVISSNENLNIVEGLQTGPLYVLSSNLPDIQLVIDANLT